MRRLIAAMTCAGVVTALGASPAAGGEGNAKKFCKTNLAINRVLNAEALDVDKLNRLLETAIETAAPEVADAVNVAVPALQANPETAFEDPAVEAAVGEIVEFLLGNCGYEQIDVTLEDYAFVGIPDEIEKGTVAFELTNEGTELHEMIVFRIKGDQSLDELLELPEEEATDKVTELGGGFAAPGESSTTFIQFKKTGRYAALCFIPVGATDEASAGAAEEAGAPPHFTEGMATEFEVTS